MKSSRVGRRICCLFVLFLVLPCACRASLLIEDVLGAWVEGRFADAERLGEETLKSEKDEKAEILTPLCGAYLKLRRYNKALRCADRLEKRIFAGDSRSSFWTESSDVAPMPNLIRASIYLDFGEYAR